MKAIMKFPLDFNADFDQPVKVPVGSMPVLVGDSGGSLCVWMECHYEHDIRSFMRDIDRKTHEVWYFRVYGTGDRIDGLGNHRGSAIVGHNVWHVYDNGKIGRVDVKIS